MRLNLAENSLYFWDRSSSRSGGDPTARTTTGGKEDAKVAVTEVREGDSSRRDITWAELRRRSGELAAALAHRGVRKGDRVMIVGANSVETLLVWLASAWLGAVFSSSSTDMGVEGILQRTAQIRPRVLFMDDATLYNGRWTDLRNKMADIVAGLRRRCGDVLELVVSVPRVPDDPKTLAGTVTLAEKWADFLASVPADKRSPPPFARLAFHEPFMVCYSSGTTGAPKAIAHSVGGVMLTYFKEGVLHERIGPDSTTLQSRAAVRKGLRDDVGGFHG